MGSVDAPISPCVLALGCNARFVARAVDTNHNLLPVVLKAAKAKKRDFTVDWVHLKLNDQAQRTVMCKDPFKAHDERVDKLIASL